MKKLIFLLIIPFILGGCYDYNQLDDLAIIEGIGIDYKDNEFYVTFEVVSTKKEGETSGSNNTYYINSKGNTLAYAFTAAANKMDKVPYFEHVEVIIFSKNVAKKHLDKCIDYLIRSERLRNEFYSVIAEDSAKELIMSSTKTHPIVSEYLVQLLKNNEETYNSSYYEPFTKTLNNILTDGKDALIPVFKTNDKEIELIGVGAFKDFELVHIFNNEESSIINLINNFKIESVHFKKTCDNDESIVIADYNSDINIIPNNKEILIKGTINARISEQTCNYDLKDAKTYTVLEKEFTKIIEQQIDNVIKKMQEISSNSLNIGRSYYNKYRIKDYFLWTRQNIKYDIDLKINKKGLTFEVIQ